MAKKQVIIPTTNFYITLVNILALSGIILGLLQLFAAVGAFKSINGGVSSVFSFVSQFPAFSGLLNPIAQYSASCNDN